MLEARARVLGHIGRMYKIEGEVEPTDASLPSAA